MSFLPSLEVLTNKDSIDLDAYGISWYQHEQDIKALRAMSKDNVSDEVLVDREINRLFGLISAESLKVDEYEEKIKQIEAGKLQESKETFMEFVKMAINKIWEWIQKGLAWIVYQIKTIGPKMRLSKIKSKVLSITKFGELELPYLPSLLKKDTPTGSADVTSYYNLTVNDLSDMLYSHIKFFSSIEGRSVGYTSFDNSSAVFQNVPCDSIGTFLDWVVQQDSALKYNFDGFESGKGMCIEQFIKTLVNNLLTSKYMSLDKNVIERSQRSEQDTVTKIIDRDERIEVYTDADSGEDRERRVNYGDTRHTTTSQHVTDITQISNYTGITFVTGQVTDVFMNPKGGWTNGAAYRTFLDPRAGLFVQYEAAYQRIYSKLDAIRNKLNNLNRTQQSKSDYMSLMRAVAFLIGAVTQASKIEGLFFNITWNCANIISYDLDNNIYQNRNAVK